MKFLYTSLLIALLFNSFGFSQTYLNQNNRNEALSLDSLPVIYIPGIMGSLTNKKYSFIDAFYFTMHL